MSHEEREALLREVVLGERQLDDPRVLAAARADASFAAELESLRAVVDSLEARAVLREVGGVVGGQTSSGAQPLRATPQAHRRRFVLVALAVAASLAIFVWRPWRRAVEDDPYLGGDVVRFEHPPSGVATNYERFAWALPPGVVRVRVTVFDALSGRECDQEFLGELQWRPAPERSARWPDAIEVEVQPIDDSESPIGRPARMRATRVER